MEMVWSKKDELQIEIPIKISESKNAEGPMPIEFMIAKKRDIKAIY